MIDAALTYIPSAVAPENFITKPERISWWGNDIHKNCVSAEEAFAKACESPEIFVSDDDVISWASGHGVLDIASNTDVLTWMQIDGFPGDSVIYDDGPYRYVAFLDPATLQNAIAEGPVKVCLAGHQIEAAWAAADRRSGWFGTGFQPDSNYDHCVSLCGFGSLAWLAQQLGVNVPPGVDGTAAGYSVFTWNSIGVLDASSLNAIACEAWLRRPTTVIRPAVKGTLGFIKAGNTPSDHVEVHLASGATCYLKRVLETATTFVNEDDGVWQLLPNEDLVFIKTANTPSGNVEVHIASRSSAYQERTLEVATTFVNEDDGVWQLLPNEDLVFIKTANTPSGNVEVHIASRSSAYQERTLEVATTFVNEDDGVWQLLPNEDLVFIKTANTPSGNVEVHIASRSSAYQERTLEVATTFVNEDDGVWQLLPNEDLVFIKTANTPSGNVEVHIASRSSAYQERTLEVPTTFVNENDGMWTLLPL
ncbi:hypothetical protein [Actinoplanes sp. L3-i22]|uniref:hypothetical protein n=1 Tax=Actinoplanes sp. L3-i22 TaxID=2836373 RepID=UPI001C858944|nr:hypothetical protein [Actinoplanes sp. L3-i22]